MQLYQLMLLYVEWNAGESLPHCCYHSEAKIVFTVNTHKHALSVIFLLMYNKKKRMINLVKFKVWK